MKRLSLKVKLTIVYTFFTILVTCTALGILISISSREVLTSTQNQLERRVQESVEDIEYDEKSEVRKAIEKFVDENPESVALLLRNWLNNDWE